MSPSARGIGKKVSSRLGGVDGNSTSARILFHPAESHPAWDEWIEIILRGYAASATCVSSRLGGVDGNLASFLASSRFGSSHPAWDEWIEINNSSNFIFLPPSHPAWDEWIEMA